MKQAQIAEVIRKRGYSMRGKPLRKHTLLVRGKCVPAIACISMPGLLDVKTLTGTSNGDTFYTFVHENLLQHVMPYNGVNPHSVVVMDICSIHCILEVLKAIQDVGTSVYFLPPYSPDFTPIEETFSEVKQSLKSIDKEATDINDLENGMHNFLM